MTPSEGDKGRIKTEGPPFQAGLQRESSKANARMAIEPYLERSLVEIRQHSQARKPHFGGPAKPVFSVAYGKMGQNLPIFHSSLFAGRAAQTVEVLSLDRLTGQA